MGFEYTNPFSTLFGYLKTQRDRVSPLKEDGSGTRLLLMLTKGDTVSGLACSETGTTLSATALGHAAGDNYRATFIANLIAFMEANGFEGLDIDWEYPNQGYTESSHKEYTKYGKLLRDLAEHFFARGWTVSMCTNLGYQMFDNDGRFIASADFVHSMAYAGWNTIMGNTVMTSGLNCCATLNVPNRRVVVGQCMYSNAAYQLGWNSCTEKIRKYYPADLLAQYDCDTIWEAWTYGSNSGNYYNWTGPSTYRAKCNRVREEGYGGVMSWGYYSDDTWDGGLSLAFHQAQCAWPQVPLTAPTYNEADGYYELSSEDDWFWFRENAANVAKVRLTADISLTHDPLPIDKFGGILDGGGHTLTLEKDTWLCTFTTTALFRTLTGTVKNLTIDLRGRVLTRADRASDTVSNKTAGLSSDDSLTRTALLAGYVGGGGALEDITLHVRPEAEIQGAKQTAIGVASVWCSATESVTFKRVNIIHEGILRAEASSSYGNALSPSNTCVGALVGQLTGPVPTSGEKLIQDCKVTLGTSSEIKAETGNSANSSVGVCIGHLHTAGWTMDGLNVAWKYGASVTGVDGMGTYSALTPWIACYFETLPDVSAKVSGKLSLPKTDFAWEDWWLKGIATLPNRGYTLELR